MSWHNHGLNGFIYLKLGLIADLLFYEASFLFVSGAVALLR